ncbi:DUF4169 family protein [uncultured Tateyamaria sp.]|uniref:DUF4169 family protein n=1 Tax=uncultured Tateyamaria sp. TaxID=455651 RepID=UPI002608DD50|nr:DUF4169 family protein [uncultured Tateyamaria sp.]
MSDSPINLNKVRKERARAADKARANQNVVAFGRSKAEKQAVGKEEERTRRQLDGKALRDDGDDTA